MKRLNSGFEMPAVGLGTYGLGGDEERDDSKDKECMQSVKDALNLGYTHIDTAEVYGRGHAEELIGVAIKNYNRKKLFITSKVFKTHLEYEDVIKSAKESLKRMGIDYLDLYLVHSFNPEVPIKETMSAMNELVEKGLIRNVGVCNFSVEQLKEAQKYSKIKIVANQMKYNLWASSSPDLRTFEYCQKNDIMVIAYKLFGRGKIEKNKIPLLGALAKKYGKSEGQIMVNGVISKKNFVAIFASKKKEHLKEGIDALKFKISDEDIKELDRVLLKVKFK